MSMKRVGLYGGAFDPPHVGHVNVATAAVTNGLLDQLVIMPTGRAQHRLTPMTAAHHRLAMCRLAFGRLPKAQVSDFELTRSGPSFTFDTLTELRRLNPQAQLFVVLGQDQLERLATWHRVDELVQIATFLVAARPMNTLANAEKQGKIAALGAQVRWLPMVPNPVSATQLREKLASFSGGDFASHLPPTRLTDAIQHQVVRYIAQNHLYQTP